MDNILDVLRATSKKMIFTRPASPAELTRCETAMGRSIPADYRAFLLQSDGGEIFAPGTELLSAREGEHSLQRFNGAEFRSRFSMPEDLLIIGFLNYGDILTIDRENGNAVLWNHEEDREETYWEDLRTFLEDQIRCFTEEN